MKRKSKGVLKKPNKNGVTNLDAVVLVFCKTTGIVINDNHFGEIAIQKVKVLRWGKTR